MGRQQIAPLDVGHLAQGGGQMTWPLHLKTETPGSNRASVVVVLQN
jgi:hypothetical protein